MSGLGQRIKCRWCGQTRHLRPGKTLLCEECDLYKDMIRDLSDQKAARRKRRWWRRGV